MVCRTELEQTIVDLFHTEHAPGLPGGWENFTDDVSATNYAEAIEETKDFWGKRWDNLKMEDFDQSMWVFTFLTDDALPYFLGAFMLLSVRNDDFQSNAFDLFCFSMPDSRKRKRAVREWARIRTRIAPFSQPQRQLIADYLEYSADRAGLDTLFMRRVLRGEITE